jgi:oligopeptide/dipeptide ABC transporter ATP-binding protein
MSAASPILEIEGLTIGFGTSVETAVVSDVSLSIRRNEVVGVIGESGSGKTLSALAVLGLLPGRARVFQGDVRLEGNLLLRLPKDTRRKLMGDRIAYIPQDAMRSLNPTLRIGDQVGEPFSIHRQTSWATARQKAVELLRMVHLAEPQKRISEYAHEYSGGMQQRAMIGMGIALEPALLIADEPTTALDVTVQAQVIGLLREIRDQHGTSILFVSHDLGLVVDFCDRVYVMYAGKIVEEGNVEEVFHRPAHPYTRALIEATPSLSAPRTVLNAIPGQVPAPSEFGQGCRFRNRCQFAKEICETEPPYKLLDQDGHLARCWFAEEI